VIGDHAAFPRFAVLADSSAWIDHFRRGNADMIRFIGAGAVVTHEFIIGELLLGSFPPGSEALTLIEGLPRVQTAGHDDVRTFVENHRVRGSGIGWTDAHLAASALIEGVGLFTKDRCLGALADRIGLKPVSE
jgi:predicted nucleic acid-binding protein